MDETLENKGFYGLQSTGETGLNGLLIPRCRVRDPGGPQKNPGQKDTKTHSERTAAIDVETASGLAARRAEVEDALAGGPTLVELRYIFSHDGGARPWRPDYGTAAWRRLCDAAGVTGVRVHDLRHMHASYLLDAGVPLHTVSRRLGHERASTTSDIYGHAIDARDQGAADLFGAMLSPRSAGEERGEP